MPTTAPPRPTYKTIALARADLKAAPDRSFTGYAWRWDDVDFMGDRILPGAFSATLSSRPPDRRPLLWDHDAGVPIGAELELREDRQGLRGTWRIATTPAADEKYTLVKDGIVSGLSIGFWDRRSEPNATGGRDIAQLDLLEISVVSIPALDSARITSVKSAGGAMPSATISTFEQTRARLQLAGVDLSIGTSFGRRVVNDRGFAQVKAGRPGSVHVPDIDTRALVVAPPGPAELHPELTGVGAPIRSVLDVLPSFENTTGTETVPSRTARSGAGPTAAGAVKPALTLAYGQPTVVLETIAGALEVTRQLVADGGDPLARRLDVDIRAAVRAAVEQQVVNGDGVSPEIRGLRQWAGIPTVAAAGTDAEAILAGIQAVMQVSGLQPDLVLVAGASWAGVVGSLAAGGLAAELRANGVAIISTPSLAAGEAMVGVSATAPTFYRRGITVAVGYVGDQLIRNMAMLLGEVDCAVIVSDPSAWTIVTGLGA